jgi:hypothetical protein
VLSCGQGPEANSPRLDDDQMTDEVLGMDTDDLEDGFGLGAVRQPIKFQ